MGHRSKFKAILTNQSARALYLIAFMAVIIQLPQILKGTPIIGVDGLFHFNRFYDTAMQIDNNHYNYFQTMYGFNGSGRIINAVYGPIFAYLVGGLLLICRSWFVFELVSNFLVLFVAGLGTRYLARAMNLTFPGQILAAGLYMTMSLTNQWTLNQSFTAVGAAVIPFVLIYGVYFYTKSDKYPWINLSITLAILTQIHFLSALIATIALLFMFIGAQLHRPETLKRLFWPLIRAVALFGLLILNLIVSLIDVNASNDLQTPFMPTNIMSKTIHFTFGHPSLRNTGLLSMVLVLVVLFGAIILFRKWNNQTRDFAIIGFMFLIVSSNWLPWNKLRELFPTLVNTLQFPSRLAVISNIIFAILGALIIITIMDRLSLHTGIKVLAIMAILSANAINVYSEVLPATRYFKRHQVMKNRYLTVKPEKISRAAERKAWKSNDLSIAMKMIQKKTPDYLPVSNITPTDDSYTLYGNDVLKNTLQPEITTDPELTLSWSADEAEKDVLVPTIVYAHSVITHNDTEIDKPKTSKVGALVIDQFAGQNKVTNHYQPHGAFWPLIYLNLFTWISAIIALCWPRQRKG